MCNDCLVGNHWNCDGQEYRDIGTPDDRGYRVMVNHCCCGLEVEDDPFGPVTILQQDWRNN